MKSRIFALILALSLPLSALAGCGGETEPVSGKTETPEKKADLGSGSKKKAEKGSDNNRKKIILDAEPTEVSFGAPASPSKKNEKGKK